MSSSDEKTGLLSHHEPESGYDSSTAARPTLSLPTNTTGGVPLLSSPVSSEPLSPTRTGRGSINPDVLDITPIPSRTLYLSLIACVLGTSFQYGYALGALNTPASVIKDAYMTDFNDNPNATKVITDSEITVLWSATVSIYCLGGLIAGAFGGAVTHHLGRKKTMVIFNVLQLLASFLMLSSLWWKKFELIIAGRFVSGIHGGIATVVCPLYLNEVSPIALRGSSGTLNQLTVVLSLALAQVLGLPQILGTADLFYYLLAIPIIPAVLHWILLWFCPESPSWLYMTKKDTVAARQALEKLRLSPVEEEVQILHQNQLELMAQPQVALKDMFTTFRKRPLMIVVVMHLSQQLSGINAVIFYSTSIFESAGLDLDESQYATLGLGGVNITMTFISMLLIERLGRRVLHLHGMGGMFIMHALLSACLLVKDINGLEWTRYGCVAFVALFIISFSIGPGSIPWFYTSELFDHASGSWAISIATAVNWAANFAVGLLFPSMQKGLQNYAFIPFMVLLGLFWFYLYHRAPETKGKSTAELTNGFKRQESKMNLPAHERRQYQTFA